MKTARLVFGILSFILVFLVLFRSCGLTLVLSNSEDLSGQYSFIFAVFLLAAGVVGIASKNNKGGIVAGMLYVFTALIGYVNDGKYSNLVVVASISLVFGITCIIGGVIVDQRKQAAETAAVQDERNRIP